MSSTVSDPLLVSEPGSDDRTAQRSDNLEDGLLQEIGESELFSVHKGTSSFWAAVSNTVGVLLGVGLLSVPYAVEQGGLLSVSLLLLIGIIMCYTSYLLGRCLAIDSKIKTYQDLGAASFGLTGRLVLTTFVYIEICASVVAYAISLGDNLAQLFPGAELSLSWVHLKPSTFLLIVSMLVVLPSVCVRDLSHVSYLSFVGAVAAATIVGAVVWTGLFGGVGFSRSVPLLQAGNLPLVTGLYAFCYAGHIVIPSIYTSMKDTREFLKVLVVSYIVTTVLYGGLALVGAYMFGEDTNEQITLNIPTHLTVATFALWTAVINPITKFAIEIAPVAKELENLLPFPVDSLSHFFCGSLIRISILLTLVISGIVIPFFGYVVAFIGSALSISMAITMPCSLYLKIFSTSLTPLEVGLNIALIIFGVILTILGTESSIKGLIQKFE